MCILCIYVFLYIYPNTIENGNISNNTVALIGKCFSSRVIAIDANVNALLSNVN